MPRKPCLDCGKLIPVGRPRCGNCELKKRRRYEATRGSVTERGYGSEWRKLRAAFLAEHPICAAPGCRRLAAHVDHVVPKRRGGADEAGNLQGMCAAHHSAKTCREDGGFGNEQKGA